MVLLPVLHSASLSTQHQVIFLAHVLYFYYYSYFSCSHDKYINYKYTKILFYRNERINKMHASAGVE